MRDIPADLTNGNECGSQSDQPCTLRVFDCPAHKVMQSWSDQYADRQNADLRIRVIR